tara:strand:+ start:59 stop:487 length:429 start_codon:yes stop_codon:yes gene_type:complete
VTKSFNFIGRLFFASAFAVSIPPKIYKFNIILENYLNKGLNEQFAFLLLFSEILCLVIGVSFFIFSKYSKIGPCLLFLYLLSNTFFYLKPFDMENFFINIGYIGALIYILTPDSRLIPSKFNFSIFIDVLESLFDLILNKKK